MENLAFYLSGDDNELFDVLHHEGSKTTLYSAYARGKLKPMLENVIRTGIITAWDDSWSHTLDDTIGFALRSDLEPLHAYVVSRFEECPPDKLYVHTISGDTAPLIDWYDDYINMDKETWFGSPIEECRGKHWLLDQDKLEAVED